MSDDGFDKMIVALACAMAGYGVMCILYLHERRRARYAEWLLRVHGWLP